MTVLERLLNLIKAKYKSDAEFERDIGLKEKTVDSWRRNKSESYYKKMSEISNLFKVSSDYLLGLSDDPVNINNLKNRRIKMNNKIWDALKEFFVEVGKILPKGNIGIVFDTQEEINLEEKVNIDYQNKLKNGILNNVDVSVETFESWIELDFDKMIPSSDQILKIGENVKNKIGSRIYIQLAKNCVYYLENVDNDNKHGESPAVPDTEIAREVSSLAEQDAREIIKNNGKVRSMDRG